MLLNFRSGHEYLERKVYGLVIARLDGNRICITSYFEQLLELTRKGIGGFLLEGGGLEEVRAFLEGALPLAEYPLFIASSVEHGMGGCLKGATLFPGPMAFAAALGSEASPSVSLVRRALSAMAAETVACRVNMPLIPHFRPEDASCPSDHVFDRLAREYGDAFHCAGIPVWREETSPSGHVTYCSHPSGTDDGIEMSVATAGEDPASGLPFLTAGGADVLLCTGDPDAFVQALCANLPLYGITEEMIDSATGKVRRAKSLMAAGRSAPSCPADYAGHEVLAREVAQRAVTLVKGQGSFLPVRDSAAVPLIYGGDAEYFLSSPLRFYVSQASHETKPIPTHERPVAFLLFEEAGNGKNGVHGDGAEWERLTRLIKGASPSIVVSFGSPRILDRFREAKVLIAAYDSSPEAQEAVFACIIGERSFEGRLPVKLALSAKEEAAS